ncbi:hypothetical protein A1351_15515 [Methylosinus sp. R-45379]|uniref:phage tail tube protein n=1 Tax=Methylosinus sp. R-45379 TaxID=980563 RepID=UPI0007C9793A|nr:phage tail tube protein [Methylosinus sp. R-45379]OAI25959.1 hypothetical protein A1351_15515 [Methylosinus sp. R-45379]
MSTTAIGKGRLTKLLFSDAGSFGTFASTGFKPTVYYTHTLMQKRPLEDNPLIGAGLNNGNDAAAPLQGLPDLSGDIVVPVDLAHFGYWLKLLLGAPTSTGSTNLSHAFASGAATLPTRDIEIEMGSSDFWQYMSLGAKSLALDISDQPGQQRATVSLLGKKRTLASSTGAGTPASIAAQDPLAAAIGQLLIDDVAAGSILSARLNYDTGAQIERYVDADDFASAIILADDAKFTGEIRVRYSGQTLESIADAMTAKKLEFKWSKGSNNALSIVAGAAYLEPAGAAIQGPGGVEASYAFRASQTSAAAMLAVTLKNQIASY